MYDRVSSWFREGKGAEWETDRGNSFWLASQLAYLVHAWICGRPHQRVRVPPRRGMGPLTLDLVRRMTSSNSWRFLARYSWSSSRSSTRCLGLGGARS